MFYVWSFVVGFCSFAVGVFGFCQIIGSIRIRHFRPVRLTVITILIWSAILIAGAIIVHIVLSDYIIAYYIGTGISFICSLGTGKNGPEE